MNYPVNITNAFTDLFIPKKALLIYERTTNAEDIYLEAFDCNAKGKIVNAHPLSEKEIRDLSHALQHHHLSRGSFLNIESLLPSNILHINWESECVIWYTPKQIRDLYFTTSLDLVDGKMALPALIWKATADELFLYAIDTQGRPELESHLYHAPFFNIYDTAEVCMGTVEIDTLEATNITEFMAAWENYFFHSKFSHVIGNTNPTKTPIHELYKMLLNSSIHFPKKELIKTNQRLKDLL